MKKAIILTVVTLLALLDSSFGQVDQDFTIEDVDENFQANDVPG